MTLKLKSTWERITHPAIVFYEIRTTGPRTKNGVQIWLGNGPESEQIPVVHKKLLSVGAESPWEEA